METYQRDFIELCIQNQILTFGEFTLKSGRKSPYFFNAGLFSSGSVIGQVGAAYAQVLMAHQLYSSILFGPAYKGIPLVVSTAMALDREYDQSVSYCYNRKEAKDHGEGGVLVGADIRGKSVLVLDDVVTAGTAFRQTMTLLDNYDVSCAGLVLALDRQERGQTGGSTVQELQVRYQVPVYSIVTLTDILNYLGDEEDAELRDYSDKIDQYRTLYGVLP